MKRITTLLIAALFTLTGVAQDKINWLTISNFEKALKKEKQNYFIFIEDNRVPTNISAEQIKERKKIMFAFLEDAKLVSYINNNFICYKFNPSSESLNFQGEEYWKIVKNGNVKNRIVIWHLAASRTTSIWVRESPLSCAFFKSHFFF